MNYLRGDAGEGCSAVGSLQKTLHARTRVGAWNRGRNKEVASVTGLLEAVDRHLGLLLGLAVRNWMIYVIKTIGYYRLTPLTIEFRIKASVIVIFEGGFQAKVIVKGMDFEYSSDGDLHLHPREARDSAAAQMLVKLLKEPNMKALKVL
ncbi:hypothetical protein GH714_010695 [Hevea brasiliensis]|uniref:Uncharacterized protein n=1 Tax=Hevea brasiliensis TaxID=3981 RepID=A0A6A6LIW5_HEVBR|nr:hypothetical protein GH714_010695 [Hevea brasiliensis]